MRLLALVALASLALAGAAEASCAPPAPIGERVARADAVIYGRVARLEERRVAVVDVLRVYRGDPVPARIRVTLGPVLDGAPAATSVDYAAAAGTDHTFYLRRHGPAAFSTDACNGSHPGPLTAEETGVLGGGRGPVEAGGTSGVGDLERALAALATVGVLAATYLGFKAALPA